MLRMVRRPGGQEGKEAELERIIEEHPPIFLHVGSLNLLPIASVRVERPLLARLYLRRKVR